METNEVYSRNVGNNASLVYGSSLGTPQPFLLTLMGVNPG
jgi:hypothetical protein